MENETFLFDLKSLDTKTLPELLQIKRNLWNQYLSDGTRRTLMTHIAVDALIGQKYPVNSNWKKLKEQDEDSSSGRRDDDLSDRKPIQ